MTAPVDDARSLLFVPGDRPDRFAKAAGFGADQRSRRSGKHGADLVVCDLEDAVAPDRRPEARTAVTTWLRGGGRAVVRCNAVGTGDYPDDLGALTGAGGLVGLMVPKAEDPAALAGIVARIGVPVIALIETAVGVLRAPEIAACGVARLAFGHLDFAADVGCPTDSGTLLFARSTVVLASRAGRLPGPIDGVTPTLDDPARAEADARRAIALGFTGKLCIHPAQLEPVHRGLAPSDDEIQWAQGIVAAASSGAASRVAGEMVDAPVLARARSILHRARPH